MADNRENSSQTVPEVLSDLADLLKAYAKQETVEPLRDLGRFLKFGVPGALLSALGVVLLAVGGLRALQTETDTTFTGNWSFAPYFIALLGAAVTIIIAVSQARKRGTKL